MMTTGPFTMYDVAMKSRLRTRIYGAADIGDHLGISRQAIKNRMTRGLMPKPDYVTVGGRPLWRESTLVRHGVIDEPREKIPA